MISAVGLTRRFGARLVVDHLTLEVGRSEIVALLGPNGAGKTTTLRMLAGLIEPTTGSVTIDRVAMTRATGGALRARIGFLTEAPGLWDRLTVRENLRIYAGIYALADPERVIDRALETFQLADRASTRAAELSKGMRQKVALARALLHEPAVLLLDEPTSGLDPEITRNVRHLLEERRAAGCAILVSTHNLDEAERLADRVAVLQGRLLALDRPATLRQRLVTGRLIVRVAGDAASLLNVARPFDGGVSAEGGTLVLTMPDGDRNVPALVRALVGAGAQIVEVRTEIPALEDVYLRLVGDDGHGVPPRMTSGPLRAESNSAWHAEARLNRERRRASLDEARVDRARPFGAAQGRPEPVEGRAKAGRLRALFMKEVLDLVRNRAALLPVALITVISLLLPVSIVVFIPSVTGHPLGDDADLVKVSQVAGLHEWLTTDARVQLFLFQQFLMVFLLIPVTGAMALAAHAIVGEKQARTLEPLLATPITTLELLVAKVLGSLVPTLAISIVGVALYFGCVALFAEPGVMRAMFTARTFLLVVLVGPAAALVSLQSAIMISSRVNDPRTAQQFGVLIIIPLTGLLVAQFTGTFWLTAAAVGLIGMGLLGVWVLLLLFSVAIFEREAILTRWR